jgi:hypothetical protein
LLGEWVDDACEAAGNGGDEIEKTCLFMICNSQSGYLSASTGRGVFHTVARLGTCRFEEVNGVSLICHCIRSKPPSARAGPLAKNKTFK